MADGAEDEAEAEAVAAPLPVPDVQDMGVGAGGAETKRLARLKGRLPPLPFNFKAAEEGGGFTKFGYSHTDKAKDWRTPLVAGTTQPTRPQPGNLFGEGECFSMSKDPDALLNPPPLTAVEKRTAKAAKKVETTRRKALSSHEKKEEDDLQEFEKLKAERIIVRRKLAVRAARVAMNYGIGLISVPAITEEMLKSMNDAITALLPNDGIVLTADQATTWVFNSSPVSGDTRLWLQDAMAAYQGCTNDYLSMLLLAEGTRFTKLEDDALAALETFRRAIQLGPFEETEVGNGDWIEMEGLEDLEDYLEPTKDEMVVSYKGSRVKLSAMGATLYMGGISVLHLMRIKLNTQLETRTRPTTHPERVRGILRRTQLKSCFEAIAAAELKKACTALGMATGTKGAMVEALIHRFAPKKRGRVLDDA